MVCSSLAPQERVGGVVLAALALAFAGVVVACMPANGFTLGGFLPMLRVTR